MAGSQVLYQQVDVDDADFVDMDRDEKMESENAEFEQFKTEMHDAQLDAKITVGKKLTDSNGRPLGRQVFECFECGIDDYTFSQLCTRIREDFGTGLYKIQGRDSKGKFKFNKTVGILAPNQTDNKPASDVGNLIAQFSDAMARQQMQTEAMFSKLAGPQTGGDAIDQITKLATAVGPLLTAIGFAPREASKSFMDQMQEFVTMQTMIKELGGGGDGGGDANLYSLLTATMQSFGGPIAAAIAAGQSSGEINAAGVLDNPTVPRIEGKTVQEKETEVLKKQILVILGNAKAGVDPKSFANIVVQNTPEEMVDKLDDFLSGDDWFEQICFLNSDCKEHEKWFTEWRDIVIELLTEPVDEPIVVESESVAESDTTGPDIRDDSDGDAAKDT